MQTMFKAYAKVKKLVSPRNARSVSMTLVTVPTVNRELGATHRLWVDKHLKIDEPVGNLYMSIDSRPIKDVNAYPSKTMRANEIANKTAITSMVAAVVILISIYC
jgi:hypothetical protein